MNISRNLGKDGALVYLPGLFGKKQQKFTPVEDIVSSWNWWQVRFGNRKESKQLWKSPNLEAGSTKWSPSRNGPVKALLQEWTPAVFWLALILPKVGIPGRRHLSDQSQVMWLPPGHQQKDWLMELPGTLLTYIVRSCLLGFIIIPPRQCPVRKK